jgi:hypothetical protein
MSKTQLTAAELQAAEQAAEDLADRIYRLHQLANAGALLPVGDPNRTKGSAFRSWLESTEQFLRGHRQLLEKASDAVPLQSLPFRFEDRSARNVLAFLLETVEAALDLLRTDAARAEPIPQPFCSMLDRRLGTSRRWDDLKHSLKYALELVQVLDADPKENGDPESRYVFRNEGGVWLVRFAEEKGRFPVARQKGLKHLAELLSKPYRPLSGMDLQGHTANGRPVEHTFQEVSDNSALDQYKIQAEELASELVVARKKNNPGEQDRLQAELSQLLEQIQSSVGPGSRLRRLGANPEDIKAFKAADRAVKRWLKQLRRNMPGLVSHLEKTINSNSPSLVYLPAYDPENPAPAWDF